MPEWGANATCPNCDYKGWMQVAGMIWCPTCGYTDEMGKPPEVRPEMIYKPKLCKVCGLPADNFRHINPDEFMDHHEYEEDDDVLG